MDSLSRRDALRAFAGVAGGAWVLPHIHTSSTTTLPQSGTPGPGGCQVGSGIDFWFNNQNPGRRNCVRTRDYWKTHSSHGPGPYDPAGGRGRGHPVFPQRQDLLPGNHHRPQVERLLPARRRVHRGEAERRGGRHDAVWRAVGLQHGAVVLPVLHAGASGAQPDPPAEGAVPREQPLLLQQRPRRHPELRQPPLEPLRPPHRDLVQRRCR